MMRTPHSRKSNKKESQEIIELRRKLEEAEQALNAIQNGEIDALIVSGESGSQIYTLKSAERPYRVMIEQMNEGAITLSEEGFILYCNESFARMVKAPVEELIATPISNYIDASSLDRFSRLIKHNGRGELTVLTKDKNLIPAYASLNTVQEDNITSHSLVLTDLTEHIRTEKVIASERFANTLLEQAADAILVCDNSGTIIRVSEKAFTLLEKNLIGRPLNQVFSNLFLVSNDFQHIRLPVTFAAIRDGKIFSGCEIVAIFKDNLSRNLILNFSQITEGSSIFGYSISLTDITDRKQAEDELCQREERFRFLIENLRSGVALMDDHGEFITVNSSFLKMFGLSSDSSIINVRSQNWSAWQVFEEDGKTLLHVDEHPVRNAALTRKAVRDRVVGVKLPSGGDLIWMIVNAEPVLKPDGTIEYLIATYHDITERKKSEEALQQYTKDLEAANKDLEAFGYSVTHDMKQPLRSLGSFTDLLYEDYKDRLDEAGKDYLERIRKASHFISELTEDMLKLSRVTRAGINREPVDLSAIAVSTINEFKSNQPSRQTEIKIDPDLSVNGDGQLLTIALRNLIENAWKFTSKCPLTHIELGSMKKDGERVYFIKDNGIGFDMQYQDKLFLPFQRLVKDKDYPGTGIGLAIVQRVIRRHGGKIWAKAELGKGATFYFTMGS